MLSLLRLMPMRFMVVNKMVDKIICKLVEEKLLKRYLYLTISLFIGAISYNLLMYPAKIVAGGGNGLAIIMQSLFNIQPSMFILIFSTSILIISIFVLGFEKSSGAIVATFVYPLFVDLTSGITSVLSVGDSDMILISLFAGVLSGFTSGIIYKMGFSSGGVSLINQMIYDKFNISVSRSSFLINMMIVILGGIYYGIETIMYAVIVLYVSSVVIDRVLLGISKNKVFYIITSKDEEVKKFLLQEIGHGITEFDIIGGYNNKNDQVIMTVVPTKDYFRVTEGIKALDKHAFFVVTDSYQLSNGS